MELHLPLCHAKLHRRDGFLRHQFPNLHHLANQSIEATGAVTWDTGNYQASATVPLLTETYTLMIMDADQDISASPRAGYLGISDQYTFGMYVPQAYTPLNEFKCATCNAALSSHERQFLSLVLGMSAITILSFTWFAGGFGVF